GYNPLGGIVTHDKGCKSNRGDDRLQMPWRHVSNQPRRSSETNLVKLIDQRVYMPIPYELHTWVQQIETELYKAREIISAGFY
ncbi:MAG TPA: hypothetical protein VFP43_10845, partial [Mesorhizobium sp.]|nr:hypothetical protein [Mesorhizobium sp.]